MTPEEKKEWTDALRSGNWPQTKGRLRDSKGFCCLGVRCDLIVRAGGGSEWINADGDLDVGGEKIVYRDANICEAEAAILPGAIAYMTFGDEDNRVGTMDLYQRKYDEEANWPAESPLWLATMPSRLDLTDLNDSGFTFNQIADLIDYFF